MQDGTQQKLKHKQSTETKNADDHMCFFRYQCFCFWSRLPAPVELSPRLEIPILWAHHRGLGPPKLASQRNMPKTVGAT